MYTSLPESPQGVADIIGLAFRLVRRNMSTIVRFILVPSIFTVISGSIFQWVLTYGTASVSDSKSWSMALALVGACLVALAIGLASWWVLGIRLLALVRAVLGFSPDLTDGLKYMSRRKFSLVGLYLLYFVLFSATLVFWLMVIFVGSFVSTLAGGAAADAAKAIVVAIFSIFSILGMLTTMSIYVFGSTLAYCVLACEDIPIASVIGRSIQYTVKYFWRAMGFGLVFVITFMVISYPLSLPVAVVAFVDALQRGLSSAAEGTSPVYRPPLYLLVITQAWEAAMGLVLRPLVFFAFGVFYYDLRLRSEGLDLKRKLSELTMVKAEAEAGQA